MGEVVDSDEASANRRERAYKCQRCLNHNRLVSRKGHQCPYKDCICSGCDLNNLRSKLMTVLRERGLNHSEVFMTKKAGRKQHCMLCSFHGERVELRGHKRHCPWAKCDCTLCTIGRHYRDTMAKQTKHRRSQRRPNSIAARTEAKSANGTSRRVSMKHDWRRRLQASRDRSHRSASECRDSTEGDGRETPSDEVNSGKQSAIDVTSAQSGGGSSEHSVVAMSWNGQRTRTPERVQSKQHGFFQPTPRSIWPAPVLGTPPGMYGLHDAHFRQTANLLNANSFPSHQLPMPLLSNMAATMATQAAAQQRQATDLAVAFLLSQYGSLPSSIFPSAGPSLCLNCHQTEVNPSTVGACHHGNGLPKMDHYLNALREYTRPSAPGAHVTLPTVLRPTETWPQATFFYK